MEGRKQGALRDGRRQEALLATFLRHCRAMPGSVDIEMVDVTLVDADCGRPANGHKDYTDVTSLNGFCAERISESEVHSTVCGFIQLLLPRAPLSSWPGLL